MRNETIGEKVEKTEVLRWGLERNLGWAWAGLVVFFAVGDTLSTAVGEMVSPGGEWNPWAAWLLLHWGLWGLVPMGLVKLGAVGLFYGCARKAKEYGIERWITGMFWVATGIFAGIVLLNLLSVLINMGRLDWLDLWLIGAH